LRQTVLALIFFSLLAVYLRVGFVTGKLKDEILEYLAQSTSQKITFDRVVYLPFWGVSIDGLVVTTPEGAKLVSAENLLLRVPVLPFLMENKVVVHEAVLNRPFLMVIPAKGGTAGGGLGPLLDEGADPYLPENVYLEKLIVRRGRIVIRERRSWKTTLETVDRLNLEVDFSEKPRIPVKGSLYLGENNYAHLLFEGRWDLTRRKHEARLKGELKKLPEWLKPHLKRGGFTLRRLGSDFDVRLHPSGATEGLYRFSIATKRSTANADFGSQRFDGDCSLKLAGAWSPGRIEVDGGAVDIQKGSLHGLPAPVRSLESLKGTLFFDRDELRFRNLQAQILETPATLTGRIGFEEGRPFVLDLNQRTDRLSILSGVLPAGFRARFDPADVRGDISVEARLRGTLAAPERLARSATVTLRNASWNPPGGTSGLSRMNGVVALKGDAIAVRNLYFARGKESFLLDGAFDVRPEAESVFTLKHEKFAGRAVVARRPGAFDVRSVELKSGRSICALSGVVEEKAGLPFELGGKARLDLGDWAERFRERWPVLKVLDPSGRAACDLKLAGRLAERESVSVKIASDMPRIRLFDKLAFEEAKVDVELKNGRLVVPYGKAFLYGGEVRFAGAMNVARAGHPLFEFRLTSMDVNLARAAPDFPFLDKQFSGRMDLSLDLKGMWNQPRAIAGSGDFRIRDGHLFTTPLFKKLGNLTFVTIEGMESVTFRSAEGAFVVADGRVRSQNTVISSPQINIEISGSVGFDQSLALNVNSRFTPDIIRESYTLGGFTPFVVGYAERQITKYAVTGTLKKPVYQEV
jgi:hypothetical protein